MTGIFPLEPIRVAPPEDIALQRQGIPEGHQVSDQVRGLVKKAVALYESLTRPKGIIADISPSELEEVFRGEGRNADPAPLPGIVERADGLALFAATIGEPVSAKIQELFQENDPATACMLDGIASERAETAADLLAGAFLDSLVRNEGVDPGVRVLPYSPGYCGWHISGQRNLFAFLKPEQIDISLNSSCLMSPLKSVSGVLVAGQPEIHDFENDFDFCLDCATWECRSRIASLNPLSPTKK
ncbi:vitamin B12 dependent-methionine synthase activation domain-containing protein [Gemmatimonadota bacterium]